ncbi:MAG: sulfurtransferase complex subunit TusC [Halioglobus sp.]
MDSAGKKSQLIIVRHSPYGNSLARAGLDAALSAAAFDQPVQLLFLGEGVLQLLSAQDSSAIASRNIFKLIGSLPLYGIETLHVDADAMGRYAIELSELPVGARPLDRSAMRQLITEHDHVLGF